MEHERLKFTLLYLGKFLRRESAQLCLTFVIAFFVLKFATKPERKGSPTHLLQLQSR